MKILLIFLGFFSFQLSAQDVCDRLESGVIPYLREVESRMSFRNNGGLLNGGVCWWHSRLQRASAYLAEFRPELAPPTTAEALDLVRRLKLMNQVVVIPGFSNFNDFTRAHQRRVQRVLEAWQREDGFINQQWLRGISGRSELSAEDMKIRMDTLYGQFQKSPHPIWVMAQIRGIVSHSLLVTEMKPVDGGYELGTIDSNYPLSATVLQYSVGQRHLKHPKDKYTFVPYLGFQGDYQRIGAGVSSYCGRGIDLRFEEIPMGEIEVSP